MNITPFTHTPGVEENASALLAMLESWGSGMNACHDLGELIRCGFDTNLGSGSHWSEPEQQVVLTLEQIEVANGHSGRYREICAGMTAELLNSMPELEPARPWEPAEAVYVPFCERTYVMSLLNFAANVGKDPALFEALYGLIDNPQLKAEKGGVALLTYLIPPLISAQTDRRLQQVWDDMLNKRPTCFNGYSKGSHYSGFDGLCGLPPLNGDVAGLPADIMPYAVATLVMMIDKEPPYSRTQDESARARDKTAGFNHKLESLYHRFEVDDLVPVLRRILEPAPKEWPAWAKEFASEIVERAYVPFLEGIRDDIYGF